MKPRIYFKGGQWHCWYQYPCITGVIARWVRGHGNTPRAAYCDHWANRLA